MKKLLLLLAATLILFSCKKEEKQQSIYPAMQVAKKEGSTFKVLNDSVLRLEWNRQLKSAYTQIEGFEVEEVPVKNTGTTTTIITAYCKDGKTTVGALLTEKKGCYYFVQDAAMVICSGCIEGCKPEPVNDKDKLSISCSSCNDCVKTEFFPDFP